MLLVVSHSSVFGQTISLYRNCVNTIYKKEFIGLEKIEVASGEAEVRETDTSFQVIPYSEEVEFRLTSSNNMSVLKKIRSLEVPVPDVIYLVNGKRIEKPYVIKCEGCSIAIIPRASKELRSLLPNDMKFVYNEISISVFDESDKLVDKIYNEGKNNIYFYTYGGDILIELLELTRTNFKGEQIKSKVHISHTFSIERD